MMNFKQQEVLDHIIATLQQQYPEVRLVSVEDITPYEFWVNLIFMPITDPMETHQTAVG